MAPFFVEKQFLVGEFFLFPQDCAIMFSIESTGHRTCGMEPNAREKEVRNMPVDMKGVIAEAFLKMIQRNGLDKITVKALIEECHISRQTFYYHFQDIMDVLEWSMGQTVEHLVKKSLQAEDLHSAIKIFVSFSVENFPMLQKLMDSQRRAQIERMLMDGMVTYLQELSQNSPESLSVSYVDREILLRYNAFGLVGILLTYGGKNNLDQERLVDQLEHIVSGQLSQWMGKQ